MFMLNQNVCSFSSPVIYDTLDTLRRDIIEVPLVLFLIGFLCAIQTKRYDYQQLRVLNIHNSFLRPNARVKPNIICYLYINCFL